MDEFQKIFEKLVRYDDPSIIFTNWLDYVIDQNLFTTKKRELNFKGNEYDYFEMFSAWVNIQNEYLKTSSEDKQWYDYLGLFYEDVIQSKYKAGNRGQFFTPENVCQAMAKLNFAGKDAEDLEGKIINDCAGGSGRLLLASRQFAPNGIFILADLDNVACKMAVLNFFIHGIRGAVVCKNTLSGEFVEAWRVNNYLGYGLNVPHIEEVHSASEAYNFFELKGEKGSGPAEVLVNPDDVEEVEVEFSPDTGVSKRITYKDGQTTLM